MPTIRVRIDACQYGLKNREGTLLMSKRWAVLTNDLAFACVGRVCSRDHPHCRTEGAETARTAFYPQPMCEAIAKHWLGMG